MNERWWAEERPELRQLGNAAGQPEGCDLRDNGLRVGAGAGTDWTNDASGLEATARHDAMCVGFDPAEQFSLSARVRVPGARTTFDAGALAVWADSDHWAKLCFEWSPQGAGMVVSVVTNETSDDANAFDVADDAVFLRVARFGAAYAFHCSQDGQTWRFVRLFRLATERPASVGFLAQSPHGPSCRAEFDRVHYDRAGLRHVRDGS